MQNLFMFVRFGVDEILRALMGSEGGCVKEGRGVMEVIDAEINSA